MRQGYLHARRLSTSTFNRRSPQSYRLYCVTDDKFSNNLEDKLVAAARGGVDIIQLRYGK